MENSEKILAWLSEWFRQQNPRLASISDCEMRSADFFAAEFIDSMGVVMLIGDVEARFSISFSEVDFQDRRFSTVNGLADIVRERLIDGR
jgi:acyl carrier protein